MHRFKPTAQRALVSVVLCATLILSACSTAWVSQAEAIVAALLPSITNIITLVALAEGKGVSASDLQLVQKGATDANNALQEVATLIDQYNAAPNKADALAKINAAIAVAKANLTDILPQLHITDPASQAKVSAVIGVVLQEITSIEALLPLVSSHPATAARLARAVSAGDFQSRYNAALTAKSGNEPLDAGAAKLKLHGPSRFGRLKVW
jgi:hypothetical protein